MPFFRSSIDPPPLWSNGPVPGGFYNFPGNGYSSNTNIFSGNNYSYSSNMNNFSGNDYTTNLYNEPVEEYRGHSSIALTTTTTVLGLKFNKGCIIAADLLGSYGTLARFRTCSRVINVNGNVLLGCGGDYADFQYLREILNLKLISEQSIGDGIKMQPRSIFCWLTRVMYNKRSKLDPLWNNYVVAGVQGGKPFLGSVDKLGTAYEDASIATGLGAHMAGPMLREVVTKRKKKGKDLPDEHRAINAILKCIEILFYRDSRAFRRYQMGIVTKHGVSIGGIKEVKANWSIANFIPMK